MNGVRAKFATTLEIILKAPEWKGTTANPPLILSKAVSICKTVYNQQLCHTGGKTVS
jgi:hypothetical protein